jgi:hypothetical protein
MHFIATPGPITYSTPRLSAESTKSSDETADIDGSFKNLRYSSSGSPIRSDSVELCGDQAKDTNFETSKRARCVLSAIDNFNPDDLGSSQSPITREQNTAAREHEQREEHDLPSGAVPRPKTPPMQETDDGANREIFSTSTVLDSDFSIVCDGVIAVDSALNARSTNVSLESANLSGLTKASRVQNGDSPVADDRILEGGTATDTPSTNLPLAEANLSALNEAIDECFRNGLELDLTGAQLLSMLTYLQGLPSETDQSLQTSSSYQEMKYISTLARNCIESQTSSGAVSIYTRMIVLSCGILKDSLYPDFMRTMEDSSPFSPIVKQKEYLNHEATILQIVIAGYFKLQLLNETPLLTASLKMLGGDTPTSKHL